MKESLWANKKLWAVVPAAGTGQRFGGETPKQYLPLLGKTLLEQTLDKLLALPQIEQVLVALAANDTYWPRLECHNHPRIRTTVGGGERAQSVLQALNALASIAGEDDWVLVHDAARPCVRVSAMQALLAQTDHNGAILGTPLSDTIKQVTAAGKPVTAGGKQEAEQFAIAATLDRRLLWAAQTPQLFPLSALRAALTDALAAGATVTDEASAMELAGWHPQVVNGGRDNIKVTVPEDFPLAAMILTWQLEAKACE